MPTKSSHPSLVQQFNRYFKGLPAQNEDEKNEVFKLRYQVYCVETGFEKKEDCQFERDSLGNRVGLELDEYDERSAHFLVRHRNSRLYAATVRLVLPDPLDVSAPFPIESHCALDCPVTDRETRNHVAEISRLAVSKAFKRRPGEAGTLAGIGENTKVYFEPDERRVLPHLTVGLFAGIVQMTRTHGITHWYAVMEPTLLRLLARFGIHFSAIGDDVHYHGLRRPCIAVVDEVLPSIKTTARPVWDLITNNGKLA